MRTLFYTLVILFGHAVSTFAQSDLRPVLAQLEAEGYFARCQAAEMRGCSYFVRLVAWRANPTGDPNSWGTLTKPQGGSNVEGYADDAVALGRDASNNVYDLVVSSGTTAARTTVNGPLPRRASDLWEAPKPLTQAQMDYLKPGSTPLPNPGPVTPNPGTPPAPAVDLKPILDAIAALSSQLAVINSAAEAAKQAAERAESKVSGIAATADATRGRVEDVLTAVDLARQSLGQPLKCVGRSPAFGGQITMTCQP